MSRRLLYRRIGSVAVLCIVAAAVGSALGPVHPAASRSCAGGLDSDFNGDGFADLAVGEPGARGSRGAVHVLYGAESGLTTAAAGGRPGDQYFDQDRLHGSGSAVVGEVFGQALATGDFNGDRCDDLAIGAPYDSDGQGMVTVLYGVPTGLQLTTGSQRIIQGFAGTAGMPEPEDLFGWALIAGDFDGNGRDDLAIGAPGEVGTGKSDFDHGAVVVVPGSGQGLRRSAATIISQNSGQVPDGSENGDRFGASLAAADF
ncbi:MAG: hypothetical protein L0Y54_18495, partial [Sporichthyaceae bacterium]|nr:hypothetical protein [Sporichthyaceae bacterium]